MQRKLDVASFAGRFEVTFVASSKLEPQLRWAVNDVFAQFTSLVEQLSQPQAEPASISELYIPPT